MECRVVIPLACLIAAGSGCATQHVALDDSYRYKHQTAAIEAGCLYVLGDITDDRRDRGSLGRLGNSFVDDPVEMPAVSGGPAVGMDSLAKSSVTGKAPVADINSLKGEKPPAALDTMEWLKNGLNSAGFPDALDAGDSKVVQVNVALKMAYIQHSLTSKASNIVLNITFNDDSTEHIVRGSSSGVNWANGAGEIRASFNRSLDKAMQELNSLAASRCQ
jgi:hypothetical protein